MTNDKVLGTLRFTVSQNVRSERQALAVSQEELAEAAGFHRTYISQVERGMANLTIDNLEKIALALRVEASRLLETK